MTKHPVQELIEQAGGTVQEMGALPDGSGFATASFPLPKDHWLTAEGFNVPPMPFRVGTAEDEHAVVAMFPSAGWPDRGQRMTRQEFAEQIRAVGRYAIRASTMNGKEIDFYPDAMLQNLIVGMLGYWTSDGLSSDDWANPPKAK